MTARWQSDPDYQVEEIEEVHRTGDDGWQLELMSRSVVFCPKLPGDVIPQPGEMVRLFGQGFGYPIRGVVIGDKCAYYRTAEEDAEYRKAEQAKADAKKESEYQASKPEFDRRIEALPPQFRERILGFRHRNPNFGPDFEAYELFTCEQAVAIATALKKSGPRGTNPETFKAFRGKTFAEQKRIVPELSDGHSGNTFGAACCLAEMWITRPGLVPKYHGAMCPVAGCEEYGCWAVSREAKDSRAGAA